MCNAWPVVVFLNVNWQTSQLFYLSAGKPKKPHALKTICLMLGPDFITDIIEVGMSFCCQLFLSIVCKHWIDGCQEYKTCQSQVRIEWMIDWLIDWFIHWLSVSKSYERVWVIFRALARVFVEHLPMGWVGPLLLWKIPWQTWHKSCCVSFCNCVSDSTNQDRKYSNFEGNVCFCHT